MDANLFNRSATAADGWVIAHCDGGSRGNPGPAAYGAVIEDAQGRELARLSNYLGKQTNNYAEYSGLLAVLSWAIENGAKRLRVISDSELMVKQMKGLYKVASPALRPLWEEARRLSRQLEGFEIRHTLRAGNALADKLANEAMDRGTGRSREQGPGTREQVAAARDQRSENRDQRTGGRDQKPSGESSGGVKAPRLVLDGYVKDGVVHLLEGELPDGAFVKVIRE
jgi:ribonuclease HI